MDVSNNTSLNLKLLLQWLEENQQGPSVPTRGQFGLIFLYAFSVIAAIVGNVIVIVVLSQRMRRRSHITFYQLNLAVADLFTSLFCVPFTFAQAHLGFWAVGSVLCPLILFLQLCLVNVSAYTNVAIGVDRFSGIVFPLKWKPSNNMRKGILLGVWSLSAAMALPEFVVGRSLSQDLGNVTHELCNEYWSTEGQRATYTLVVFVVVLVLPLLTLSVTYTCVVITLWFKSAPGNADARRDRRRVASKKKVTRMLIIVVAMFALCWLPLHLFNIIMDFRPDLVAMVAEKVLQNVYFSCHWLAMSHAFANPIIYVTVDEDFRTKVICVLRCRRYLFEGRRQHSYLISGSRRKANTPDSIRGRKRATTFPHNTPLSATRTKKPLNECRSMSPTLSRSERRKHELADRSKTPLFQCRSMSPTGSRENVNNLKTSVSTKSSVISSSSCSTLSSVVPVSTPALQQKKRPSQQVIQRSKGIESVDSIHGDKIMTESSPNRDIVLIHNEASGDIKPFSACD